MKKILCILLLALLLCGCLSTKVTNDEVTINLCEDFDINSILTNVSKNSDVTYEIDKDNSKLIITITKGDKIEIIEKEITIEEPNYSIKENISFNPYRDYDINEFITVDEGVDIDYSLDIESSTLTFNLSKGNWSKTIDKEVTLESLFDFSNVGEYGALIYKMINWENKPADFQSRFYNVIPPFGSIDIYVFAKDHTGFCMRYIVKSILPIEETFTWDDEGNIVFDGKFVRFDGEHPVFGGEDGINATFYFNGEGNLVIVSDLKENSERLTFERIDSYEPPFIVWDYCANFGKRPSEAWYGIEALEAAWYEPVFNKYADDYNGAKGYAANYPSRD